MNYINYRNDDGTIETIEDMRGMIRQHKIELINNYKTVSANYYASSRAAKDFYSSNKD